MGGERMATWNTLLCMCQKDSSQTTTVKIFVSGMKERSDTREQWLFTFYSHCCNIFFLENSCGERK